MKRVVARLSILLAFGCDSVGEEPAEVASPPGHAEPAAEPVAQRNAHEGVPDPAEAPALDALAARPPAADPLAQATPETADPAASPAQAEGGAVVAPLPLSLEQARALLSGVSSLSAYAASFEPFSQSDIDAAIRRGKRSRANITTWAFAPALSVWRPAEGVAFQVLSGRAGEDRALLAVVRASADGYEHVASTTLSERGSSLAIAYRESAPAELLFTTCYGCAGESGSLRFGTDDDVTLEFR